MESVGAQSLAANQPFWESEQTTKLRTAYDVLKQRQLQNESIDSVTLSPNVAYESYLKMHKNLAGEATTNDLVSISEQLSTEFMPRYLIAAGWAAAEAALVGTNQPTGKRFELLQRSEDYWVRAIDNQVSLNMSEKPYLIEYATPYRCALDVACLPLMRGIVAGDVTQQSCEKAFQDCLNIAEANLVQLDLASRSNHFSAVSDHAGFGFECNALLALNRLRSPTWFAIPAIARADSGYYYGCQTHDLLAIRQKRGQIQSIVPIEVKSKTSLTDRNRYQSLLVRGKMHLNLEGGSNHFPRHTLHAISAVYRGEATPRQAQTAQKVSDTLTKMLSDYYAGDCLGKVAIDRVRPYFRDNSLVISRHPGLSKEPQYR